MLDLLKMAWRGTGSVDESNKSGQAENRNFEIKVSGSLQGTYQVNGVNNWLQAAKLVQADIDAKYGEQPHIRLKAREN